ncbi:MAG TPA: SpoIIE family protein phosphatase [Gemmataceae bacterium]|nr:SpoIIE family protein phosphatase [Gemmataceae bacterium]
MPVLHILRGESPGRRVPLDADRIVLGRSPECQLVINGPSVSRQHARIVRVQGQFFIEDMQSRNGTFVNNQPITTRTALKHNDRVRVCDFVAAFLETPTRPADLTCDDSEVPTRPAARPTALHLPPAGTRPYQDQSAENLRLILDIGNTLAKTLELDALLPQIADSLFGLFRQADRCFLVLQDEATGKLVPKVVRTRRPDDQDKAGFSQTIVRECLETGQPRLADSTTGLPANQSIIGHRIRSFMCAPLINAQGKPFGVLQVDTQEYNRHYTQADLNLLWAVANQASIALENARLCLEMQEREQMERDLELAAQVQRSILPENVPEVPGWEFFAHYAAALEVGGDYYDFIPLPGGRWAVAVADVVGKGMAAALLMAKFSSDTRFCLLAEPTPAAAFARLNDLVHQYVLRTDRFVTLAAALLDPARQAVTVFNAGHPKPLLYRRATGTLQEVFVNGAAGAPLGVTKGRAYEPGELRLHPGDCLLLYTDGVSDAANVQGERFGMPGIQAAARGGPFGPRALGRRVVEAVEQFAVGRSQHDDITVVCFGKTAP